MQSGKFSKIVTNPSDHLLRVSFRFLSDAVEPTANEGSRHRAYAEMLGVDDYIRKPFAMERLLESVEKFCPLDKEATE